MEGFGASLVQNGKALALVSLVTRKQREHTMRSFTLMVAIWMLTMVCSMGMAAQYANALVKKSTSHKIQISRRMPVNPLMKQDVSSRTLSILNGMSSRRV
jgi:hypothetical protein